jgi:hypothetical protein
MNNAIYNFREPENEPVFEYKPGSQERKLLEEELKVQSNQIIDIPLIIGEKRSVQEKQERLLCLPTTGIFWQLIIWHQRKRLHLLLSQLLKPKMNG